MELWSSSVLLLLLEFLAFVPQRSLGKTLAVSVICNAVRTSRNAAEVSGIHPLFLAHMSHCK